jgi:D-mannonate dehydratase
MDRDRKLQTGDLEHPADLVILAANDQGPAVAAVIEALPGADDQRDPSRINELALREVDKQRAFAALKRFLKRTLQIGSGAEIKLTADGDRPDTLFKISDLYLEGSGIHGSMLPQAGFSASVCFVWSSQG